MKKLTIFAVQVANLALAAQSTTQPLAAAPTPEAVPPIAGEQLFGTVLRIQPKIGYETASLRIAGPDGYALSKRFVAGDPIDADLLAEAEPLDAMLPPIPGAEPGPRPQAEPWRALPDGQYVYEVDFATGPATGSRAGDRHVHSSHFYAENGALISRQQKQSGPPQPASETDGAEPRASGATSAAPGSGPSAQALEVEDLLDLQDGNRDGLVIMALRSFDDPPDDPDWQFLNDAGRLDIKLWGDLTPHVRLLPNGHVGIGTNAPLQELHIASPDGGDIRLSGGPGGGDWTLGVLQNAGHFGIDDPTNPAGSILLIRKGAPANSVVVTVTGDIGVGTAVPTAKLHVAGDGRIDGDVALGSSRTLKTAFHAVDPAEVLAKLADLPVAAWRYKTEDESRHHIGPFAEDFQRLFGLGDGETISVIDAQGVALAAIQGLQQGVDAELQRLRARNQELTQRLSALEEALAALAAERE